MGYLLIGLILAVGYFFLETRYFRVFEYESEYTAWITFGLVIAWPLVGACLLILGIVQGLVNLADKIYD